MYSFSCQSDPVSFFPNLKSRLNYFYGRMDLATLPRWSKLIVLLLNFGRLWHRIPSVFKSIVSVFEDVWILQNCTIFEEVNQLLVVGLAVLWQSIWEVDSLHTYSIRHSIGEMLISHLLHLLGRPLRLLEFWRSSGILLIWSGLILMWGSLRLIWKDRLLGVRGIAIYDGVSILAGLCQRVFL